MKIRSITELEDFISAEYAWRRKELTNIRNIALSTRKASQGSLLRASIPILYAHWEGFVKHLAMAKIQYLVAIGHKYSDLAPSFHAYAVLEEYKGKTLTKNFEALAKIMEGRIDLSKSIKISPEKYIDAKSNLNSEVLKEIAIKASLDYSHFELKEKLIDESFLGLRNKICHGERVSITTEDFEDLYREVTELIDLFKNLVLNSVYDKSYLRKVE
jgi:MAE_28990/MAE_18760-like HEPN